MNLKQIFDHLTYGELHTAFISETDENGELGDLNKVRLLSHINSGLVALYTRFVIKKNLLNIKIIPGVRNYKLCQGNMFIPEDGTGFITDTYGRPLEGEVIKITGAYKPNNEPVPINANGNPRSAFTNLSNEFTVPQIYIDTNILVDVVEGPRQFVSSDILLPEEYTEIDLPFTYLTALGYYIASRIYNPIGIEDPMKQGINYARSFEMECRNLENIGVDNKETYEEDRFDSGGWV